MSGIGIDVSSDRLDICAPGGRPFRVSNDRPGLLAALARLPKGVPVHMEASGGYERLAHHMLEEAGYQVRVHNPRKVRRLADARSVSAKTDPIDARHLSESGSLLKEPRPKGRSRCLACDISRAIEALVEDVERYKKRAALPGLDPAAKAALQRAARDLGLAKRELERAFRERAKAEPALRERVLLAMSVPDIGEATARVLACELPEDLSGLEGANVASYAGLAPITESSGRARPKARVRPGNVHLKRAMYMPAVGALARRQWARELYTRLRSQGRTHDQAMVALMRRLLVMAFAVMKRGSAWQAEPPDKRLTN